jgi:hypothetical protein
VGVTTTLCITAQQQHLQPQHHHPQQDIRLFRYFIATNGSLLRLVAFCYFKIGDSACWVDLVESAFKHPSILQHARGDLSTQRPLAQWHSFRKRAGAQWGWRPWTTFPSL